MVVCTGEVAGKVADNGLLSRSSMDVLDDMMIVLHTIHPSIDEAAVADLSQTVGGTGVGKALDGGAGGLRAGIHKRKGVTVSERDNIPDDSTSSVVSVHHYCCCCSYWSLLVAHIGAAAVLYLRFAGQSTILETMLWTMSKTLMPWMLLGYDGMDGGNGTGEAMVDDGCHEDSTNILLVSAAVVVVAPQYVSNVNVDDVGEDSLRTGDSEPGAETYVSDERQLNPLHHQLMKMTLSYSNLHALAVAVALLTFLVQSAPKPLRVVVHVNGEGIASNHHLLLLPHADTIERCRDQWRELRQKWWRDLNEAPTNRVVRILSSNGADTSFLIPMPRETRVPRLLFLCFL